MNFATSDLSIQLGHKGKHKLECMNILKWVKWSAKESKEKFRQGLGGFFMLTSAKFDIIENQLDLRGRSVKSQQRGLVSQKDLGKHASLAQRKSEGNQLQRMSALFPLRQRYFYLQKRQNNCILPWAPAPLASFFLGFGIYLLLLLLLGFE